MAAITKKQEEILRELKQFPEDTMDEILDFIKFLKLRDSDAADVYVPGADSLEEDWLEPEEDKAWQDI